jgi:rhodanese-related sulfurtransferase
MPVNVLSSPATIVPARPARHEVAPEEALALVAAGAFVVDLRPPRPFAEDGHVPGAVRLPMEALACAPALVPEDGRHVLCVCERGALSRRAAALLADAGVTPVGSLAGGMARWTGERAFGSTPPYGPSPWLVSNALLASPGARTLDVACGRGRHALLLASAGSLVRAVDRDPLKVAWLRDTARRLRLPLDAEILDLEQGEVALGEEEWDLVLVFNYLHRPLFPALQRALRPGGVLLCETFTVEHARRHGRPSQQRHLLEPGELPRLVAPLEVLREREGEFDGRYVASVAARKPSRPSRSVSRSQAAEAPSVAARPSTHSRPARSRATPSSGPGHRTPGARKR